jgi:hypothetical protein
MSVRGYQTVSMEILFATTTVNSCEGRHNNGMHPTPLHDVSHVRCVGARVMPGVRRLVAKHEDERLAGRVSRKNTVASSDVA